MVGDGSRALFHQASNPDESGLVSPQSLVSLWANLRSLSAESVATQLVDEVIREKASGWLDSADGAAWLIADCFPAGAILQGAQRWLARCSVVVVRVVLQSTASIPQAGEEEAAKLLAPLSFRCLKVIASRHPAVGYAVWARDWDQSWRQEVQKLKHQIAELAQTREAQAKAAAEQDRQLVGLRKELTKLQAERGRLAEQVKAQSERIVVLEQELSERDARLHALEDEITRTEAQIDLIKDWVLQDNEQLVPHANPNERACF